MANTRDSYNIRRTVSLPPGTPVFVGEQLVDKVSISYIQYNKDEINEGSVSHMENDFPTMSNEYITWVNVVGVHDIKLIKSIGDRLQIDPIIIEDIVDTSSRPRIEDLGEYFFFSLKDIIFLPDKLELLQEQFTFIVSDNYVVTFQEDVGDLFDIIRERLRKNVGKLRKGGVDYLFNRLIDVIVDNYFVVVEDLGTNIDELEPTVISSPSKETLQIIQNLKSELIYLRRLIQPVREMVGILTKLDHIVISDETIVFTRSIYDHLNQIIDSVEIYREMLTGFLEIYLSSISNKTNDVMKVLTIITSIFVPMSFLAGVYGMNFQYMPELALRWTYPLLWIIFLSIASGMIYYFKKLGWLSLD